MAIAWSRSQKARVKRLLAAHPVNSGRCERLAARLLPIGRERDPTASNWRLLPAEGRYVVPRIKLDTLWYFHVTTAADAHCVDALTGIDGTARAEYAEAHWTEADALLWIAAEGT